MSRQIDQTHLIEMLTEINPRAVHRISDGATDLFEAGVLDSYSIVQLVLALEERLGRPFDYQDIQQIHFRTLSGLIRLLRDKYDPPAVEP